MPFEIIESKQENAVVIANALGVATHTFASPKAGTQWKVGRIAVRSVPGNASQASAYIDEVADQNTVDTTNSGDRDIADELTPILVGPTSRFIIQWIGAAPQAVCSVLIQYDVEAIALRNHPGRRR